MGGPVTNADAIFLPLKSAIDSIISVGLETGAKRWRVDLKDRLPGTYSTADLTWLVALEEVVLCSVTPLQDPHGRPTCGYLLALDAETGSLSWRLEGGLIEYLCSSGPDVFTVERGNFGLLDTLFDFGTTSSRREYRVRKIDTRSGSSCWSRQLVTPDVDGAVEVAQPSLASRTFYVPVQSASGQSKCVINQIDVGDADGRDPLRLNARLDDNIVALEGRLFFAALGESRRLGTNGPAIVAIDVEDWSVAWKRETDPTSNPNQIAVSDKAVVYYEASGLTSVDSATGSLHWRDDALSRSPLSSNLRSPHCSRRRRPVEDIPSNGR
jgi:outer membrane protein assembly factor BamB